MGSARLSARLRPDLEEAPTEVTVELDSLTARALREAHSRVHELRLTSAQGDLHRLPIVIDAAPDWKIPPGARDATRRVLEAAR